jgi:hypothetical protein
MTKTLKQIQEFNRRKIICAVNGTENYQEALQLEYDKQGYNTISVPLQEYENTLSVPLREYEGEDLSLDRVLLALEPYPNNFGIVASNIARIDRKNHTYNFICPWGLTKPTLEEQLEETQRAIYELLGGENE